MKILVTGCAGFIGSNLVDELLSRGYEVIGVDNFNNYYDPIIKRGNIQNALNSAKFKLYESDICNFSEISHIFKKGKPDKVVHLAARAGVRASIDNPKLYTKVNVLGTVNLLMLSVQNSTGQFVFGSSSSVYGESKQLPFGEKDLCTSIISPYGASKRAVEFFVESFHHSFKLSCIILRFFTVYGERGRPDMAPAIFTKAILNEKLITQFGDGTSSRDYTYIGDIVLGIISALDHDFRFEIFNLGNSHQVTLSDFISTLEKITAKKAKIETAAKHEGDVDKTWANIVKAKKLLGWEPKVNIYLGLTKYIEWLRDTNRK